MDDTPRYPSLEQLIEHFPKLLEMLNNEQDYPCALLIGSYIDSALIAILRSRLACKSTAKNLTESDGPIGTSSRRADLAYCVGIISKGELVAIKAVCDIRNLFAHGWDSEMSFKAKSIRDKCMNLNYPNRTISGLGNMVFLPLKSSELSVEPKTRFIQVGMHAVTSLLRSKGEFPRIETYTVDE